jgi:uncharacterized protein YjbI with pentapeptide repeats
MRKYGVMRWRDWLGAGERRWKKAPDEEVQPAKTLWDWLQLLIVPTILIAVTFLWSASQTRSDNRREDRRIAADRAAAEEARQDATLQSYLDQMSGLMIHEKLLTSREGDPVRAVARTVTLATLRRLDAERRGAVIKFLSEARVLDGENPRVLLDGADLEGANLALAELEGANLASTNLKGADLAYAHLRRSNLALVNLEGANLRGADLSAADLGSANLGAADLTDAYLTQANLDFADLTHAILVHVDADRAILTSANLEGANLKGTRLREANLSHAQLDGANLEGVDLYYASLEWANNLDLSRLLNNQPPEWQKRFLDSQKAFLDSLSPDELAEFNLSPGKLANFRRQAAGG